MTSAKTPYTALYRSLERKATLRCNSITKAQASSSTLTNVIELTNASFENGTILIAPDYYVWTVASTDTKVVGSTKGKIFRLTEDISFNPNPSVAANFTDHWTKGDPLAAQLVGGGGDYPDEAYRLGFFAAIALFADDVIIDLNGYTLAQSLEHSIQQRFYANIELASIPFLPTQGPHTFGTAIEAATNCSIINGTLGLSSHHGIHGHSCREIMIKDVTFSDYEVSPMQLNGVNDLYVMNCVATGHSQDVKVLATWSAGRFLRPYLDWLNTYQPAHAITIQSVSTDVPTIRTALMTAMENALDDITTNGVTTDALFQNVTELPEGNTYGFSVHGHGVAVNGFPDTRKKLSTNVYFKNVEVRGHIGEVNERPALESYYADGAAQNIVDANKGLHERDARGAVFQTQNTTTINGSGDYLGNALANAQALVAKAIIDAVMPGPISEGGAGTNGQILSTKRMTISQTTIDWIEEAGGYIPYTERNLLFNGDSMHHVNKGLVGYKIDGVDDSAFCDCIAAELKNRTPAIANSALNVTAWTPLARFLDEYNSYKNRTAKSNIHATLFGANGNNVRGFNLSSSGNIYMLKCKTRDLESNFGECVGIDLQHKSTNIYMEGCEVVGVEAGLEGGLDSYNNNPESAPIGYGIRAATTTTAICLDNCSASEIAGLQSAQDMAIQTDSATIK